MKMFVMLAVTAGLSFGFPGSFVIAKDVKPVELLAYRRGIEALFEASCLPLGVGSFDTLVGKSQSTGPFKIERWVYVSC